MLPLRSVELKPSARDERGFPFNIPLIKNFECIDLNIPVTFFVGENGSGKSTLLEGLAAAAHAITAGQVDIHDDKSLAHVHKLAQHMRLVWNKRTNKGFFLRAEDFFGYARRVTETDNELNTISMDLEGHLSGFGLELARGAIAGQREAMRKMYDGGLDAHSHGESFLQFFEARVKTNGIYFLDEPETPLSPQRQLSLLSLLKQASDGEAQFIIATHSPILMALPGARIYSFDRHPVQQVKYEDLDHVTVTRDFLNNPERFLKHL
jgi:predicted ATPase